ncbi:MAG: sulfate transporter, inner rane subunit [Acidimicrobiia bacterium]|nr:sulfate transporter, inner rane subunit [Acidimicrobiia bacterium]
MAEVVAPGRSKYVLRFVALAYLAVLLVLPVGLIFWRTFEHGVGPVWDDLTAPNALHAFRVTIVVAFFAVVANTVFGLGLAIVLVRWRFPGRRLLNSVVDLPIAVPPTVVGLALILVYGSNSSVGGWFNEHGVKIIFSTPGMVLATIFVSLPLVVREVAPVLEEIGVDQEQAAWTLGASPTQAFRRVTLPAIRWALAYGVVLTLARCLGEYGAVAVVSGRLVGKTQTATLYVQERFQNFDQPAAYAMAFALAGIAVVVLVVINLLRPDEDA